MSKERISANGYKYAPESIRINVNGQNIESTAAKYNFCCGRIEEAKAEAKKEYRRKNKTPRKYVFAFPTDTSEFYYIYALNFTEADDIQTRLYCYKELKHYLQKNPPIITTESGHFTPNGSTKPETIRTDGKKINYKKLLKIRIKEA